MADYTPPTENLPIFDKVVFLSGNEFITTSQADKRYLRYPNAQGTENLQAIVVNGIATMNSTLTMNNTTLATNRKISSSYYVITDSNINGSLSNVGQIYSNGSSMFIQNDVNTSTINLVVKNGSGNPVYPLTLSSTVATTNVPLTISANNNLTMNTGTGIINQPTVTGDTTSINLLRRTQVNVNSNNAGGSAIPAISIEDNINNRGMIFLANAGPGNYQSLVQPNDAVICSRLNNAGVLTLCTYADDCRLGMRMFNTDLNNMGLNINCGASSNRNAITMSFNKTTPIGTITYDSYSHTFRILPTATPSNVLVLNNSLNTTYRRMYQELNSSWSNVNGFYEMAKDVYPTLNPLSSGVYSVGTWTTRTNPVNNQWYSVCWSPQLKLFACVAGSGGTDRIMTSPDGINWTSRTSPNSIYNTIIWVQELSLFIAVSGNIGTDNITTSPDGITWTSRTTPNNIFTCVCWSPELSLLVAVASSGTNNRVATSPDGITWTSRTSPADNSWNGVCWSAELGLFVAVAYSGTGNRVMTSPDGINWTIRTSPADNNWQRVCWSSELGIFVAVGETGTNRVMTSTNGIDWTLRTSIGNRWKDICWSPELKLFVAVSDSGTNNRVMTSPNGINWTSRTTNSNEWWGICWSPELGIFVACGITGTNTRIMTSSLKGRPPTSSNVFDSSSNSISEAGNWNLTANVINADTLSIKQIAAAQNSLDVVFDGGQATYIKSKASSGQSTLFFNTYNGASDDETMSVSSTRIQVKRPIQFSYSTTPSTTSQLGFLTSGNLTTSTGVSSQSDPTSAGSISLSTGTWQIIVLFEFKGSSGHNLTTFEYAISNSSTAFPTTAPYNVAYMYEPNTTLKLSKISKQLCLTLQLTGSITLYFLEKLSWSGGGTVDISGFYTYTRIG